MADNSTGAAIEAARRYLLAHQTPDGGWGYHAGGMAFADATVLAALALAEPTGWAASRSLDFLLTLRRDTGFATCKPDREASWMTAHALLLLARFSPAQQGNLSAAVAYLLSSDRAYDRPEHDAAGWPWVPGTASWVEPTAWTILALGSTGHAGASRVAQAVDMLSRNVSKGGGWSLYEHRPFPYHTGLVLLALEAAGAPAGTVTRAALGFLQAADASTPSALDAAFRCWALTRALAPEAPAARRALETMQRPDGSLGAGPFDTALAVLALCATAGSDPILGPVRAGAGATGAPGDAPGGQAR